MRMTGDQDALVRRKAAAACVSAKNPAKVSTHPSFQINREPIWHVDHLEPLLNFFIKLHFAQVFTLTGLRAKHTQSH